jgi:hypothetical protein
MILFLAPNVRKIKFFRHGNCLGSVWRSRHGLSWRKQICPRTEHVAHIFYNDGRVEKVPQRASGKYLD